MTEDKKPNPDLFQHDMTEGELKAELKKLMPFYKPIFRLFFTFFCNLLLEAVEDMGKDDSTKQARIAIRTVEKKLHEAMVMEMAWSKNKNQRKIITNLPTAAMPGGNPLVGPN